MIGEAVLAYFMLKTAIRYLLSSPQGLFFVTKAVKTLFFSLIYKIQYFNSSYGLQLCWTFLPAFVAIMYPRHSLEITPQPLLHLREKQNNTYVIDVSSKDCLMSTLREPIRKSKRNLDASFAQWHIIYSFTVKCILYSHHYWLEIHCISSLRLPLISTKYIILGYASVHSCLFFPCPAVKCPTFGHDEKPSSMCHNHDIYWPSCWFNARKAVQDGNHCKMRGHLW